MIKLRDNRFGDNAPLFKRERDGNEFVSAKSEELPEQNRSSAPDGAFATAMIALILLNLLLGVMGGRIMEWMKQGIMMFD